MRFAKGSDGDIGADVWERLVYREQIIAEGDDMGFGDNGKILTSKNDASSPTDFGFIRSLLAVAGAITILSLVLAGLGFAAAMMLAGFRFGMSLVN